MRASRLLPILFAMSLTGAAPLPAPRRIVSLDMCADQLIVALADRDRIAAVTEWARDPRLSAVADRARGLPFTRRTAEEVMALHPDLIVGAPFRTAAVLAPLKVRMLDMPYADSVAGIEQSIRVIADAVGYPERGAAMIAGMRRDLRRIGPPPGRGRVAAYYQRQAYLTGTGTLVDDMMRRAGLVNLSTRLRRSALSKLSVEEMALARPDFLVMDAGTRAVSDHGTAILHHPAIAATVPAARRLYIPQALTVCGGPGYPRAVAMLVAGIRDADRLGLAARHMLTD